MPYDTPTIMSNIRKREDSVLDSTSELMDMSENLSNFDSVSLKEKITRKKKSKKNQSKKKGKN